MPRNSSGVFSLVAGNPVITGTNIASDWANTTMPDIGNEITDSLNRSGKGGMLAPLRCIDGTVGAPSVAAINDTQTGFYWPSASDLRVSVGGTDALSFTLDKATFYDEILISTTTPLLSFFNNSTSRLYEITAKAGSEPGGYLRLETDADATGGSNIFMGGIDEWESGVTIGAYMTLQSLGADLAGAEVRLNSSNHVLQPNNLYLYHGDSTDASLTIDGAESQKIRRFGIDELIVAQNGYSIDFTNPADGAMHSRVEQFSDPAVPNLRLSGTNTGSTGAYIQINGPSVSPSQDNAIQIYHGDDRGNEAMYIDGPESQKVRRNGADEMIVAQNGVSITFENPTTNASTYDLEMTSDADRNRLNIYDSGFVGAFIQLFGANDSSSPSRTGIGGFGVTQFTIDGDESQKVRRNGADEMIVAQNGGELLLANPDNLSNVAELVALAGSTRHGFILRVDTASLSITGQNDVPAGGERFDCYLFSQVQLLIDGDESQKVRRGGADQLIMIQSDPLLAITQGGDFNNPAKYPISGVRSLRNYYTGFVDSNTPPAGNYHGILVWSTLSTGTDYYYAEFSCGATSNSTGLYFRTVRNNNGAFTFGPWKTLQFAALLFTASSVRALDNEDVANIVIVDAPITLTLDQNTGEDGGKIDIITEAAATLNQGAGVTITWLQGGSTSTGNRTIAIGSKVELLRKTATEWFLSGNGIS